MAFDLEAAFTKFTADTMAKLSAQDDKIKTIAAVRKTGAVPVAPAGTPGNPRPPGEIIGIRRSRDGVMNSKGFSFSNVMLCVGDPSTYDMDSLCPNEKNLMVDMTNKLTKAGYKPERSNNTGQGFAKVAPMFPEMFDTPKERVFDSEELYGMKSYLDGGVDGADPDEAKWLVSKYFGAKAAGTPSPAQAAFADTSLGGSLIGPPTFGPPIELLRNVEALMNAGATTMPIGPTGSILMPKLVAPTVMTMIGENKFLTPSTYQTGQITLRAKKGMVVVVMPGELLRFGGPAVEMLARNDMMKSVALGMDYQLLFGAGGDVVPLGLYTMAANTQASNGGIYVAPTAGNPGQSGYGVVIVAPSNSNQLSPQDIYDFQAGIQKNNANPTAYIMAPTMFAGFRKARFTPYSGGTSQGTFIFDLTRALDGTSEDAIDNKKVVVTNQIPVTMAAWTGTGSLLTGAWTNIFLGKWDEYMIALFGGIEFAQEQGGIQLFGADQIAVRTMASFDGAPRYPGLFATVAPATPILPSLIN